jgi:hypothetical protein
MAHLGMYVHTHWGYRHPYAARTWSFDDWRGYASGLAALGYDTLLIWPSTDVMPDPLTPSDAAHLEKMARVIDMLHDDFGMTVLLTASPNVIGNEHGGEYTFENRPFFTCEHLCNPADPAEMALLFARRKAHFGLLARADGLAVIDADPGGYIGSGRADFPKLLLGYLDLLRELNPAMHLYYWMWFGWEMNNRHAAAWTGPDLPEGFEWTVPLLDFIALISPEDYAVTLDALLAQPNPNWRLLSCFPEHQAAIEARGLQDRTLFYPYGVMEGEPTFPLTNWYPERLASIFTRYDPARMGLGAMGNGQTHAVQLPHTYAFAHFARGGTLATLDLRGFAEGVLPGRGAAVAEGWEAIGGDDPARMHAAAADLDALPDAPADGPYRGLLFGDPARFRRDLVMQLRFRADTLTLAVAVRDGADPRPALRALAASWGDWWRQTGYVDGFNGPVRALFTDILPALHHPALDPIIRDFTRWDVSQEVRQSVLPRLLAAMEAVASQSD